jgi:D-beta-D-heptose 7-phosphate kinase/D-beta-D-heptose 1-phosphate adenosyltransferase
MDYGRLFDLGEKKVLVIGDIILDIYQYGKCNRISPEAPVPVIDFSNEEKMLGGAGNVLKNLVSFGAMCDIISVIGEDFSGSIVLEKLKDLKVSSKLLIIDKTRRTTEKCRIVSSGQQLIRIDKEDKHPITIEIEDIVINYVNDNLNYYDVIVFSDYLKGFLTDRICNEIIKLAKSNNIITLVDPKGANYKKYKDSDLIKPNLKEAELLIEQKIQTEDDIKIACMKLKNLLNCKNVVITLAEKGIAFFDDTFDIIPTQSCQVFDVSGAGDTVLASLAICLKQKYSLYDSCFFSNKAASVVIRKFGSNTTTIKEVINLN